MRQDNVQRKVHGASWFFLSLICVYLCVVMILWKTNIGSHITMVQNLILSQSMIFVPTIIYILISKCDLRETLRLKKTHWLAIIIVPAFVVALEPLMTLINAISLLWVESATTELATGLVSNHKLWVSTLLTWTFHLRKGVKFHSGKELTAEDVKATYDRQLIKEDPVRYTQTMGFIDHCDIVDDYTINLVTLEPAGPMLASLTLRANTLLNKDYIEKYGKELGKEVESVDGTGPFKLVEWNKDEDMHLVRFDDYFNGPAATENIRIQIVPEAASRAIAMESHQVDAAINISAEDVLRFKEDDTLNVFSIPGPGCHLFQFNCSNPIIKDTKVRQAISYALDRTALVEALWGAMGEKPRDSVAPPAAFGYINLGVIQQDQAKAKELLAEAGYPDGFEMNLMCTDVYNKGVQAGEIAAAQLAEVGIKCNLVVVDRATFSAAWNGLTPEEFPDWGMFLMGAGYITLDGDEGLKRRFATEEDGKNSNNYGFYSNAEVDELLNGAAKTTNQEWREKAYQRAAEILYLEDPVGCYLNSRNETVILSAQVEDFNMTPVGIYDWPSIKVRAN